MSDEAERITAYLSGGGLFNPELADHEAVRDLLIDCRAALATAPVDSFCRVCHADAPFTGGCGGGRNNPRALCFVAPAQPDFSDVIAIQKAEAEPEALRLHALTAQAPNQPGGFSSGDMASAAAQGYRDGWTAAQTISAEPAAHVQNPAEIEHVAGDVSKNGVKLNVSTQQTAAEATEEVENLRKSLVYVAFALHATPQYMLAQGITLIDGDTVRVSRDGWTVEASVNPHRQTAPATQQAGATKEHVRLVRVIADKIEDGTLFQSGIYSNKDLARFVRNVADAAAPQPSPTAQAAESVPAIQGEMNVQLDIDSNHSAPGQQRDVARSVALGQPMGNGQDQAAGRPSAQGDKLLTVAERNIRSLLRSAQFKCESDREAALNCVDVLWAAARAPADSQLGGFSAGDMASQGAEQFRVGQASMLAALEDAHRLGFWRAAIWADRDDLIADTGSPAYIKDRATDLAALAGTAPVSQEYAEQMRAFADATHALRLEGKP